MRLTKLRASRSLQGFLVVVGKDFLARVDGKLHDRGSHLRRFSVAESRPSLGSHCPPFMAAKITPNPFLFEILVVPARSAVKMAY